MQAPFFVIFVLVHIVFTPLESKVQHQNVRVLGVYAIDQYQTEKAAGDACVAQLEQEYGHENADVSTNSWGCVRVEHPSNPQRRHEGSGGMRS